MKFTSSLAIAALLGSVAIEDINAIQVLNRNAKQCQVVTHDSCTNV